MTLEEMLLSLDGDGAALNNLFQLPDGMWRCNLRLVREYAGLEFATAATPAEAVRQAIEVFHRKYPEAGL